jgi:hypothetical protein
MKLTNNLNEFPYPAEKLIHNAQLTNLHSTSNFLTKAFDLGLINFPFKPSSTGFVFYAEKVDKQVLEQFLQVLDILRLQHKENVDVNFIKEEAVFIPVITVLYPKLEVVNSLGKKHTIKDLLVVYTFKVKQSRANLLLESMKGLRFCVTQAELQAQHLHSHLPSRNFLSECNVPNIFCLGSDTDIRNCEFDLTSNFSLEKYEAFFFLVDSMLKWESLEGVPYNRMSRVHLSQYTPVDDLQNSFFQEKAKDFVIFLINQKVKLDLNFYCSNHHYKIYNDDKAKTFFLSMYRLATSTSNNITFTSNIVVYRVPNSNSYVRGDVKKTLADPKHYPFTDYIIFKGKKVYPKVLKNNPNTTIDLKSQDLVLHPKFIENVIRELEYQIYKETIENYRVKAYNSNRNESNSISSNTISL